MTSTVSGRSALLTQILDLSKTIRDDIPDLEPTLRSIEDRCETPLRVAIAGKLKAGKSTLLNALLGEELAASDAGECTKVVTWYRHGTDYDVVATDHQGETVAVPFERSGNALNIDLGGRAPEEVERIDVRAPTPELELMTMIDTPGTGSLSTGIAAKSLDFLTPEAGEGTPVDAVIYLLRHLHATDVSFLHAFHDREFASPSPVNCVGVLSRADEVAAGRLDAMQSAERIAQRYSADARMRRLVQAVIPVAGLIGQASVSLDASEFDLLQRIAQTDRALVDSSLLSIDRFVASSGSSDNTADEHATLLDRLGLFGTRLSVEALRTGRVSDAAGLAAMLRDESGIDRLATTLIVLFGARRDTLKARSALISIERALHGRQVPPSIDAHIERVWAGAHEFTEIRALNVLRDADIGLEPQQLIEAERLLGTAGTTTSQRLGLGDDATIDGQRAVALDAIDRWRTIGASPIASRPLTAIADVVVRTCEGMFVQLS